MPTRLEMSDRRSVQSSSGSRLPARMVLAAGLGLLAGLVAGSSTWSDVRRSSAPADPRVKRTWADVQAETEKVFEGCLERVHKVRDNRPLGALAVSGRIRTSLRPDTSYQALQYRRKIDRNFPETIPILDVRLERDYSHELSAASSFRIVPNLVEHEGKLMYASILDYLQKNKFAYEVIDPKSEHGKTLAERYRQQTASP